MSLQSFCKDWNSNIVWNELIFYLEIKEGNAGIFFMI